jgi:hypothetical protein
VQPQIGSTQGGTIVTLTGVGFGSDESLVSISFNSKEATILSVTPSQITFSTPAGTNNVTVNVSVNQVTSTFFYSYSEGIQLITLSYIIAVTPIVTEISPLIGTVIGRTTITILGSEFSASIADISVQLGDYPCIVTSTSTTSITCHTDGNLPGNYSVAVQIAGKGLAEGDFIFNFVFGIKFALYLFVIALEIQYVSQTSGSMNGGSLIHIQGNGFVVGKTVAYVKLGPDQLCDIITSNFTYTKKINYLISIVTLFAQLLSAFKENTRFLSN